MITLIIRILHHIPLPSIPTQMAQHMQPRQSHQIINRPTRRLISLTNTMTGDMLLVFETGYHSHVLDLLTVLL